MGPELEPPSRHRSVWFLTGTRADFGKLKPLIERTVDLGDVDVTVVVTGMHLLERYGSTVNEVRRLGPSVRIVELHNLSEATTMDRILARTVDGLADLIDVQTPDLFVVHGDRVEALAGAAVGALRNVPVAHVEGGEVSGTIDGILRHAISKLSHVHLVANDDAARRVVQLGEAPETVFAIGSPDIDVMLSNQLPSIERVLADYEIPFDDYAVVILHGVTTEPVEETRACAVALVDVLIASSLSAVVIYPNNDPGTDEIMGEYERLDDASRFTLLPSMRFESFLTLLRHARVMVGNSSAGVREAPIYGVPSVNIGSRQRDRHTHDTIIHAEATEESIRDALTQAATMRRGVPSLHFGEGDSAQRFADLLAASVLFELGPDKVFRDVPFAHS